MSASSSMSQSHLVISIPDLFGSRSDGLHTQNGVRIKTWPGGKYGYGKVYNVTYEDIKISGADSPIVVDTCYSNSADVSSYMLRLCTIDLRLISITFSIVTKIPRWWT
jgi:hypothetical protein